MAGPMLSERIMTASAGRDRVLDAVKTGSLVLVILAHSLAWHIDDGTAGNVLQVRPELAALTWGFQILALFFAAGAVNNAASFSRAGNPGRWLGHRLRRLLGPVLVYATFFSALLLPLALVLGGPAQFVGKFLAQLLWFAGVYLVVVALVPWTSRHQGWPVLLAWFAAIVAVDVLRLQVDPALGWLNMLLVWGWLHQVGYRLPALRSGPKPALVAAALVCLGAALALAFLGPYSNAMVSVAGDPEPSNLAPPTVVVALHGLALVLLLAAAADPLDRLLQRPRWWVPIAVLGSRGMGLYLWHIPIVGTIAGACLMRDIAPPALSGRWWALHAATAVVVIGGAWLLAGIAEKAHPLLDRVPARTGSGRSSALTAAAGMLTLLLSVTGFGSWWTAAFLGLPAGTALVLGLLWLVWRLRPADSDSLNLNLARPAAASALDPGG